MNRRPLTGSAALWCLALLTPANFGQKVFADNPSGPAVAFLKYEEPRLLTGTIYARGSEGRNPLFRFKRTTTRSGSTLNVSREYTYPDGRPAAREHVVYHGDTLVLYETDELQTGATGKVRIEHAPGESARGTVHFEYTSEPGRRPKLGTETVSDSALINDTVVPFLLSHWDALRRGEKVRCRCLVVPRRETVGFTILEDKESTWRGRSVVQVRMEATSPFVGALVDPLLFTVEKAPPHRVLRYIGRTTPKIQSDGKWKDLDAVTVFDWE